MIGFLEVSLGDCPNCGGPLFTGHRLLKKEHRSVMTIDCRACGFDWPASEEAYWEMWPNLKPKGRHLRKDKHQ